MFTQEKIIEIIKAVKPGIEFAAEDELIRSGLLESMDILLLATRLGEEFDLTISPLDLKEENFATVAAIVAMLEDIADRF